MNTTKTVLITGASSGIGLELSKIFASKQHNLILVARNEPKLLELKKEFEEKKRIQVVVISKDLSVTNAAQEVYDKVCELNIQVDYLINNAGFGDFGFFVETNWEKEERMIHLNVIALTQMTKLFAQEMVERKSGKILNVASVASFLPGPLMAVYFATKAFVLSFSEAIDNEMREHGVSVTALCPGPTQSGFEAVAFDHKAKMFDDNKNPTSESVALFGYQEMMRGNTTSVHGLYNKFLVFIIRLVPRKMVVKITRKMQSN
jgi:uncharacterized protein